MDHLILVLVLVFLTGFLFAPLGLGGGLLFVPILHYVAGLPLDASVLIISLILTGCVSYGSGFVHRKEGLMADEIIRTTEPFAFLGAIIGAFVVNAMGNSLDPVFKSLAMFVLICALIKTTRRIRHGRSEKDGGEIESLSMGEVRWETEIEMTTVLDLYAVTLTLNYDGNDELGIEPGERRSKIFLLRKTWGGHSDFSSERNRLLEDVREKIEKIKEQRRGR